MSKEKYTQEFLEPVVRESHSISEVLTRVDLRIGGDHHGYIQRKIKKYGLDTSHFTKPLMRRTSIPPYTKETFLEALNAQKKFWSGSRLMNKLLQFGLKERKCEQCQHDHWNDQPIPLQVHHIDGDNHHQFNQGKT